jgi:flagellar basal-body rod modification protein FlgD
MGVIMASPITSLTTPNSSLNQADFLKLLTTQLSNQDPSNPMSDTEFASQLAQFSTLQGIQQLNASFSDLLALQQLTQGSNLVGRTVVYQSPDSSGIAQGTVNSVSILNGTMQVDVGGVVVPLNLIRGFTQANGAA